MSAPSLEAQVKAYLKERYGKPGNVYLGIPHRLDRPVSGVIVFARNTKAARRLAEQFQSRQARKVYWALVQDYVQPDQGVWEDWIRKVPDEARAERVSADSPGARLALLRYRVLSADSGLSLLELQPQTGRMHQIRLQAAVRGHPVCGDVLYGATRSFGPSADLPRDRIIALHARQLGLLHPIRFEPLEWTAALPQAWEAVEIRLPEGAFKSSRSDPGPRCSTAP